MPIVKREPFPQSDFARLAQAEADNWWFCARNRLIIWLFRKRAGHFTDFLEIGCGTGFVLAALRRAFPDARMHGTEYFDEGLDFARRRVPDANFRRLDAMRLADEEAYDVIGAFDVLEHIDDDVTVLGNITRALRRGGVLVMTVPQHPALWSPADEAAHHVRRYTRLELHRKLQSAGLEPIYSTGFVSLLLPAMWLSRWCTKAGRYDPWDEFRIPRWLDRILAAIMSVEMAIIRSGLRFPLGGSLLVAARKSG